MPKGVPFCLFLRRDSGRLGGRFRRRRSFSRNRLAVDDHLAIPQTDMGGIAGLQLTLQHQLRYGILHLVLDGPAQRTGTVLGIKAVTGQLGHGVIVGDQGDALLRHALAGNGEHTAGDLHDVLLGQLAEHDDLIDTVQELGAEGVLQVGHDRLADTGEASLLSFLPALFVAVKAQLGGIGVKGLTPTERLGNPAPRIAETPQGILNCVGLQNPGIDRFIEEQIPFLRRYDTKIIANVSGNTVEEYEGMVEKISDADVDLIEMNISCPNVKCGGMAFGTQPKMVEEVVSAAKAKAKKPLIVKLSPNVTDIAEIARAAESAGADALSLINTLLGMRIDIEKRKPILSNVMGGLSGPAVFPVAVRMVYQVRKAVSVPILGMGGIRTGRDIVEMMLAGADAVAMGTVMFNDPTAPVKALAELNEWLDAHGVKSVTELSGAVEVG